jgi:hypothetical protein
VSLLKEETDLLELALTADSELLLVNEQLMASYDELIQVFYAYSRAERGDSLKEQELSE